jgi:hypothetical protein
MTRANALSNILVMCTVIGLIAGLLQAADGESVAAAFLTGGAAFSAAAALGLAILTFLFRDKNDDATR